MKTLPQKCEDLSLGPYNHVNLGVVVCTCNPGVSLVRWETDKRIPGCSQASYLGKHGSEQREPTSDKLEGEYWCQRLFPDFYMCALHTCTYT